MTHLSPKSCRDRQPICYFPPDTVNPNVLRSSRMKSLCPWKGLASYYHLEAGGKRNPNRLDLPSPVPMALTCRVQA